VIEVFEPFEIGNGNSTTVHEEIGANDNTLLDNDRVKTEIKQSLVKVLGHGEANHFWKHHDEFRSKNNLVDFPKIIEKYCAEKHTDSCTIKLKNIFFIIDFKMAMYPTAVATLKHLKSIGKVAIFTEGDMVYQKRKVEQLGLNKLVNKIYLYLHKSDHIDEILSKWKGYTKIFVDDRSAKLIKIKRQYPDIRIVEVCQGHYSDKDHTPHKKLDMTIESIGDLLKNTKEDFIE